MAANRNGGMSSTDELPADADLHRLAFREDTIDGTAEIPG